MIRASLAATAVALLLSAPTLADEVWRTGAGDVVYEADEDELAILSFPFERTRAMAYFPDLGGNFDDRSTHEGYWIAPKTGKNDCGARMTGPDGTRSDTWGRATIIFHKSGFPSGITLLLGSCFKDWDVGIIGTPVTGK